MPPPLPLGRTDGQKQLHDEPNGHHQRPLRAAITGFGVSCCSAIDVYHEVGTPLLLLKRSTCIVFEYSLSTI